MDVRFVQSKSILTKQNNGFLVQGYYPFTHTLSWAVGCGFGTIYCGKYCYAQMFPNWLYNKQEGENWGDAVIIKENAPELLDAKLNRTKERDKLRIYMSPVTDVYQPLERKHRVTRRCLDVFKKYDDLDLLCIQTRSPIVVDDLELIASIPYAFLSMTIETDLGGLSIGPKQAFIDQRFDAVQQAVAAGIPTQITVSPCLPYTENFAQRLIDSGASRIVVDTFKDGDGSQGSRTAKSMFAIEVDYDWMNTDPARALYHQL